MSAAEIVIAIVCFWLGYRSGWVQAHVAVGKECDRLGGFYVGETVYECKRKEVKDEHAA